MIQVLKTWPEHFSDVVRGIKDFEVRKNDRNFQIGDHIVLCEYIPEDNNFTGKTCHKTVKHILHGGQFGIEKGYCVLGLK